MKRAKRSPLVLALLGAGCFVDAPGESGSESSIAETTTSLGTTAGGVDSTESAGTTTGTTGQGTTRGQESTTAATLATTTGTSGTTLATTSTSSTSDGSTTMEPLPNPLIIPPTVAACVLLESGSNDYLGPDACTEVATGQNGTEAQGILALDAQLLLAMGRPAQIYLSFPLPPLLDELTITNVELSMVIADGRVATGTIGDLHRVAGFSMESLGSAAPATQELLLADPEVEFEPGTTVKRTLPPEVIVDALEQSSLHLGILPTNTDNTFFHGTKSGESLQPTLSITYE